MNKAKYIKIKAAVAISILIAFTLQGCERDDICAESTPTTPRLIVEFYDASSPDDLKSVPRLTVYGDSPDIPVPDDEDSSSAILEEILGTTRVYNVTTNSIGLPLIIGAEEEVTTTRFVLEQRTNLRLDDNDNTNSNLDIIEIAYNNEFDYVSRACGYKSIFTNITVTLQPDGDTWISGIEVVEDIEQTVENENTVHVRILH